MLQYLSWNYNQRYNNHINYIFGLCYNTVLYKTAYITVMAEIIDSSPSEKMAAISQMTFSNAFSRMKSFVFSFQFHWFFPLWSNWQWISIGLGNGLAPTRRQAFTWTNGDRTQRRIYAALVGDALINFELHINGSLIYGIWRKSTML